MTLQPGAALGQRTYCPVSGVVFEVKDRSAHRERHGQTYYFCCESCAQYFVENEARVAAARAY